MIEESLVSDLEVIDFLELFNSTVEAARMLGISQSSCSRRYRAFSSRYGISFDRIADRYQAAGNFDVLASLRQASQKLRVRQGCPRICVGWQLGDLEIPGLREAGVVLPIRSMNAWRMLSLLEQRLVDVALMGLMEFESLLGHPLSRLRARRMAMSPTMLCIPVGSYDLKLMAHCQHPLQGNAELDAETLAQFPSPALPLGMAPTLMGALQSHGLANQLCGLDEYDQDRWEGLARDGVALSYGAPHRVPTLCNQYDLKPLSYELGIRECIGLVGHRDVIADAGFPASFNQCVGSLRAAMNGQGSGVQWLS
jgi:DNA-binding transcriptional LysR family regulator